MDLIISAFHIDWHIILAQIFNFSVVFFVLYFFGIKPIYKLMDERAEKVARGVEDAKKYSALLEKTQKECESILNNARYEADKIIKDGKQEALLKRSLMLEETKKETVSLIEETKKNLENERLNMIATVKKDISSLIIKTMEKILGEKANGVFNEKIINTLNKL